MKANLPSNSSGIKISNFILYKLSLILHSSDLKQVSMKQTRHDILRNNKAVSKRKLSGSSNTSIARKSIMESFGLDSIPESKNITFKYLTFRTKFQISQNEDTYKSGLKEFKE